MVPSADLAQRLEQELRIVHLSVVDARPFAVGHVEGTHVNDHLIGIRVATPASKGSAFPQKTCCWVFNTGPDPQIMSMSREQEGVAVDPVRLSQLALHLPIQVGQAIRELSTPAGMRNM